MGLPCRACDYSHPLQDSDLEAGEPEGGRGRRHPLWLRPSSPECLLEREAPNNPLMPPPISKDLPHFLLLTKKHFLCAAPAPVPLFPFSCSISMIQVPAGHSAFQNQSCWAH